MKIRLHYNRKATDGKVWTLHTYKACYRFTEVHFSVPVHTEYKKNQKKNPKAFLWANGKITVSDKGKVAIIESIV